MTVQGRAYGVTGVGPGHSLWAPQGQSAPRGPPEGPENGLGPGWDLDTEQGEGGHPEQKSGMNTPVTGVLGSPLGNGKSSGFDQHVRGR